MAKRLLSVQVVHFRCDPNEAAKVAVLCKEAGFTRSDFIRGSILEFANYVSRYGGGLSLKRGDSVIAACLDGETRRVLENLSSTLGLTNSDVMREAIKYGLPSLRDAIAIRKEERRAYRLKRLERLEKLRARLAKSKAVRHV